MVELILRPVREQKKWRPKLVITTAGKIEQLQSTIESVIHGKADVVQLSLVALLAGGHLLIEDVPGVGKTTLAQALARSFDCSFQRLQFTSDMLPSDIVGLEIYNQKRGEFDFKPGPIFANVILADEINRTTPKTQSALLEAMAEGHVTVEQDTYQLPKPFMVLATQNPVEHHGTYPLPESQLDRFMMRLRMGYPDAEDEKVILRQQTLNSPLDHIRPVMSGNDILELQHEVRQVAVDESLVDYLINIVRASRETEILNLGVSPRGSLALYHASQALAYIEGRDFVIPDDIKRLVVPIFAHRIIVNSRFSIGLRRSDEAEAALKEILRNINVPL
ncbi:MAG: MoxR family ATPase [Acidobacteria bacterium]|nr:MoxR family ATPase [Acidobacteriota bacterium]